jgi:hypothetical protein
MTINNGINLTEIMRIAIMLGCLVKPPKGTGEVRFSHPRMTKPVKQHFGRPASRAVVVWVRRLIETLSEK